MSVQAKNDQARFSNTPVIGVDILGSDTPSHELLDAVLMYATENPASANFLVFGQSQDFKNIRPLSNLNFVECQDFIRMDEEPIKALKSKPDASMLLGIGKLKEKKMDAFISFGNTGALLASCALNLESLPGITRPALLATLPTKKSPLAVVDVGANISVNPKQLVEFAKIGIAYQKSVGISNPKVGLLNIGTESNKGTPMLKEAFELFSSSIASQFVGNIEARDIFEGNIDVLIADGFSGNILLKTAEGIGEMVLWELKKSSVMNTGDLVLFELQSKLSYSKYPGAIFAGLDGIVMKCHGAAHPTALICSIERAVALYHQNFISRLKDHLKS